MKIKKILARVAIGLGVSALAVNTFVPTASAALYVTDSMGGSAQLTANFNGGNSCVSDTSDKSYVTLRAYNSSNQVMWTIQDNTRNGVAVCNYTVGGVHHLIAYLNNTSVAPANVKTWRANKPSSSWVLNSCYPRC